MLIRDHGGKVKHKFRHITAYAATVSDTGKERLKNNPKIKYIVDDIVYQVVDPVATSTVPVEYAKSWGVEHTGGAVAHAKGLTGSGIQVAVLDTGIDYAHPELAAQYQGGWDVVFSDNDPMDDSWNSHGTHVAGIIGAAANGTGVVGMVPDVELYAVKVLDGGGFGLLSWIIEGIEWAVDAGMDVVNISIGGPHSAPFQEACDAAYDAGLLLVAAAGNGNEVAYPGGYDSVIAVTGTDKADQRAWFGPSGPQVELAAPGLAIQSTVAGGSYGELSGTSQASPHVTGLAALIYQAGAKDLNSDNIVDNRDVRLLLQLSSQDLGDSGRDEIYGFGLIDAPSALALDDVPNEGITFDLVSKSHSDRNQTVVKLSGARFLISLENTSLRAVNLQIYEHGMLRKDLSEKIRFTGQSAQEVTLMIDAAATELQAVFEPAGKFGAMATVTVTHQE